MAMLTLRYSDGKRKSTFLFNAFYYHPTSSVVDHEYALSWVSVRPKHPRTPYSFLLDDVVPMRLRYPQDQDLLYMLKSPQMSQCLAPQGAQQTLVKGINTRPLDKTILSSCDMKRRAMRSLLTILATALLRFYATIHEEQGQAGRNFSF